MATITAHEKEAVFDLGRGSGDMRRARGAPALFQRGLCPPGQLGLSRVMALPGYMQVLGGEPCSSEELLSVSSRMRV